MDHEVESPADARFEAMCDRATDLIAEHGGARAALGALGLDGELLDGMTEWLREQAPADQGQVLEVGLLLGTQLAVGRQHGVE